MTTLDLNKYEQIAQVVKNKEEVSEAETNPENGEKTVTLTGPLTQVYAQALMSVLGENTIQYAGETNAIETSAILMFKDNEHKNLDDSIIYVNDQENVSDNPSTAYDNLRVALDKKATNHYVVFESNNSANIGKASAYLYDYAHKNASRVFYSRESFLKFVK